MTFKYKDEIGEIAAKTMAEILPNPYQSLNHDTFIFYINRIQNAVDYGLYQGREIIKMVCRCAFNDSCLTDRESAVIISLCHNYRIDTILMEVNYNEGW